MLRINTKEVFKKEIEKNLLDSSQIVNFIYSNRKQLIINNIKTI